ncbi:MAG: methylated-DNA--[protein]-cysteine S-methyltransferase [Deltaproteobacteria bacterium]|nr:methylated-DNA--[protein]-cysteine S-methyltransferase [Deltaproteobacteria bacterium]
MSTRPQSFTVDRVDTPIGAMLLVTDRQERLRALDWADHEERMHRLLRRHYRGTGFALTPGATLASVRRPLDAYFAGELTAIDGIPVETGGTPFQRDVWAALRRIPAGQTRSYGALAAEIGRPSAVRAVGLANGANPVGLVVPCHRVIGADGSLTGYGGGLERKRWFLAHERSSL